MNVHRAARHRSLRQCRRQPALRRRDRCGRGRPGTAAVQVGRADEERRGRREGIPARRGHARSPPAEARLQPHHLFRLRRRRRRQIRRPLLLLLLLLLPILLLLLLLLPFLLLLLLLLPVLLLLLLLLPFLLLPLPIVLRQ